MITISKKLDVEADKQGTYLVTFIKNKGMYYDGIKNFFSEYGKVASVCDEGNRLIHIRYFEKDSALKCYKELHNDPNYQVDLPDKFILVTEFDKFLLKSKNEESHISFYEFHRPKKCETVSTSKNTNRKWEHYICQKRKIIHSTAFQCFIMSSLTCNIKIGTKDYYESLIEELKFQMRGVSLDFKTGFDNEIEHNAGTNDFHRIILAQDLNYFNNINKINATDVLICNLPPWYQEVDAYKLMLPLVPHDLLGIDLYTNAAKERANPYCVVYLKIKEAAFSLIYQLDNLLIDKHKICVYWMEDVESILVELKNNTM